jgi:tetratricopeptide (TPR) repeat protein
MGFYGIVVALLLTATIAAVVLVRSRAGCLTRPRYFSSEKKLKRAARWGNTDAQYRLGTACLEAGRDQEAFYWLFRSARAGNARAQNLVGMMYEAGQPVGQNDREAVYWYRESAKRGWPDGQVNAGYMYCLGRGVRKDYIEARRWFEQAADAGYVQGKNNLAWLLSTCPDTPLRNGKAAAMLLEPVVQDGQRHPVLLDTLAAAYAEEGMFDEAVALVKEALATVSSVDQPGLQRQMGLRLAAYEDGRPWREPPGPSVATPAQSEGHKPAQSEAEAPAVPEEEIPFLLDETALLPQETPAVPEEAAGPHVIAAPAAPDKTAARKAAAKPRQSKKKAAPKARATTPAPKKAAPPAQRTKQQPKKAVSGRAPAAGPAAVRAKATVLRPAPAATPAPPDGDRETDYKPASWEDVAREFSVALQPEEVPDAGPVDDSTYDEHQKALDFSDSLVEAIIHDRYAEIYRKMERAYRDAVPENQIAAMLEQMYDTYGGKPLEAEFETDEIGQREYGDGKRAVHKFWYAIRTPRHKKGVYSLFVEIVGQEGRMVCSSFFIARSHSAAGIQEA